MSKPFPLPANAEIIDIEPPRKRRWLRWLLVLAALLLFAASRGLSIYISALWFGSLGYSAVYWYIFKLKFGLFVAFALLTLLILRGAFWLLTRAFGSLTLERRTIMLNNQPFQFSPARFINPVAWIVSVICGLIFGLSMKDGWQRFALYLHQTATQNHDPI